MTTTRARAWDTLLTERDDEFLKQRESQDRGFGGRPVLIVIDMQYMACGDHREPFFDMIKRWPGGCGPEAWDAIAKQQELIAEARSAGIPIIYSRYIPELIQFDGFAKKNPSPAEQPDPTEQRWQIVEEIAPEEGDIVLDKSYASVMFGTPLVSWLTAMRVDTTIIVGNSTGGCVRASAIDLTTHNYNVIVVEDAVFDRVELSHGAALLDLWMKYCDVLFKDEVSEYLASVTNGIAPEPVPV
jgi:nicotinamidase-related amidase